MCTQKHTHITASKLSWGINILEWVKQVTLGCLIMYRWAYVMWVCVSLLQFKTSNPDVDQLLIGSEKHNTNPNAPCRLKIIRFHFGAEKFEDQATLESKICLLCEPFFVCCVDLLSLFRESNNAPHTIFANDNNTRILPQAFMCFIFYHWIQCDGRSREHLLCAWLFQTNTNQPEQIQISECTIFKPRLEQIHTRWCVICIKNNSIEWEMRIYTDVMGCIIIETCTPP